eukprot:CAMPEP_0206144262 /NCGR_PEP_ID=MMETSP1473-20131121/23537_1 /ASSEMBLY_ACC=CAM_ASM_001109 /TAXON_ID=1461547 /ORGANISM="Stichococcus sp, Strain RCC1054" /LENGTH=435 /DNA_ID=CAMNT_0053540033 /DNA_START=219 /DNA_END=1526 /DNA_ORIENTATION=-
MKVSLVSRIVSLIGASLMVVLVLQATGLLDVINSQTKGSGKPQDGVFTRTLPGAGPRWKELADRYAADIALHDQDKGLQVVWYGDDLVESWRGSSAGGPCPACDGVPSMWGKHFGSLYRAQAYGIAGEQTANLLWRLRKGGHAKRHSPAVTVLHAGASDLDAAYAVAGKVGTRRAAPGIAARIESIVKLLHGKRPSGRIIILGLLPRLPLSAAAAAAAPGSPPDRAAGILDDSGGASSALASQAKSEGLEDTAGGPMFWPSPLGPGVTAVNARLERIAEKYPGATFVDCSPALLQQHGTESTVQRAQRVIDPLLVPGGRQPGAEGMHRVGLCLDSLVHYLATSPPPLSDNLHPDEVDDATPDKPKDLQGALKAPAVAPSLAAAADSVAVGAAAAQGLAPRGPQSAEEAATLGVQAAVGAQAAAASKAYGRSFSVP